MTFKSDIEIAQACEKKKITEIAAAAGVEDKYLEQYGNYKAKIDLSIMQDCKKEDGKLVLVTAITPTPAGEGKTTTTIGLADAMQKIGKNTMVALREPSLGPVFGIKGGATGGGYAQVVPMEDINLHFTGDFHAIGAANNLLAAMIDNHIFQGNELNIDLESRLNTHGSANRSTGAGAYLKRVSREVDNFISLIRPLLEIVDILRCVYRRGLRQNLALVISLIKVIGHNINAVRIDLIFKSYLV